VSGIHATAAGPAALDAVVGVTSPTSPYRHWASGMDRSSGSQVCSVTTASGSNAMRAVASLPPLGRHAVLAHNLLPEEYRAIFGLNAGQGLVGPSYRAVLQKGAERLRPYWPDVAANLVERRGSWQGRRMRLQARRNPENLNRWRAAAFKGGARVRELRANGQWKPTGGFRDPAVAAEMSARAQQRLRELRADPVWSATYRETLRQANVGGPIDVTCKVCGRAIQTSRRDPRRGVGQLCGDACR
jgi:hypothetical protein